MCIRDSNDTFASIDPKDYYERLSAYREQLEAANSTETDGAATAEPSASPAAEG